MMARSRSWWLSGIKEDEEQTWVRYLRRER
jgi:hypothetical protein